ncbi:MAG TPA: zinc/iron-chelating domain-containing protein [Spirochaetia bacterium]|nr:MAG: hypothetical protein A2Y41_08585 [Spirochaetes bacterium GWB1_36_13]HCL56302.1 zinc/iron-chelating domain-containing protein [Spirochaetia bacterium]
MECRAGCAACCIVVSISSPLPLMPEGKKAGVRCASLREDNTCRIHNLPGYPDVCRNLTPNPEMCGVKNEDAYQFLAELEKRTAP